MKALCTGDLTLDLQSEIAAARPDGFIAYGASPSGAHLCCPAQAIEHDERVDQPNVYPVTRCGIKSPCPVCRIEAQPKTPRVSGSQATDVDERALQAIQNASGGARGVRAVWRGSAASEYEPQRRCARRMMRWAVAVLLAGTLAARAGNIGTDPSHKYAWSENVGWANAGPTNVEVTVHYYEGTGGWLSGYAWGENIGWIAMGSAGGGPYANSASNNWGVNLAVNGDLSGYAWGENVGWINFGAAQCDAAINTTNGEFSGHAWGENIGWLKFKGISPDYGVRSMAFYTQPQGTPNWWLDHHTVTEWHDAGDGVPAWQKYVMDVSPTNANNYLVITGISNAPAGKIVVFTPASTRRYYTLARRDDLMAGGWSSVAGQMSVPGFGGSQTMKDTNTSARAFYSVNVTVAP